MGPACERVIEQLPALNEYFLIFIPKNDKDTMKKQKYLDIVAVLKTPSLKAVLEFTAFIAKTFNCEFTGKMQKKRTFDTHIIFTIKNFDLFIIVKYH